MMCGYIDMTVIVQDVRNKLLLVNMDRHEKDVQYPNLVNNMVSWVGQNTWVVDILDLFK